MLAELRATWCPPEREALRTAVHGVVRFYREVAPAVAERYGLLYPYELEAVVLGQLEEWHEGSVPAPDRSADQGRQDLEAVIAALRAEERLIRDLSDLERPVTAVDRANIALELLRMLDRFVGLQNELRTLLGKPPIPTRPEWEDEFGRLCESPAKDPPDGMERAGD